MKMMDRLRLALGVGLLGIGWALNAQAAASAPWIPSLGARHALELLIDDGGLDLVSMQWPLPAAAVEDAIARLPASLPDELEVARRTVLDELRRDRQSHAVLNVRNRTELLAGYGQESTPGSSLSSRTPVMGNEHVALRLGVRDDLDAPGPPGATHVRFDDSAIVGQVGPIELQAFDHRAWWGPGWQSALPLSNNMPAMAGIGFQRASAGTSDSPWLHWLGPWNYQAFISQEEGVAQPLHPFLVGNRLTFKPFSHLEVGLTEDMVWGGKGRPESLGTFLHGLVSAGSNPTTDGSGKPIDTADLLAGYDLRVRCPDAFHCALYGQMMGEDEAGKLPTKFLTLVGGEWWTADGRDRAFIEYVDTSCRTELWSSAINDCGYRNHAYPYAKTSELRWWGAGVGPDSRLTTLGLIDAPTESSLRLYYGHVGSRIGQFSPTYLDPQYSGHVVGASAQRVFHWNQVAITPQADVAKLWAPDGKRTDSRFSVALDMPLDTGIEAFDRGLVDVRSSPWTFALGGIALLGVSAAFDHKSDQWAIQHGTSPLARGFEHVGSDLPLLELAFAGLDWGMRGKLSTDNVAFASLEAGIGAAVSAEVLKRVVDRAPPNAGLGASNFEHVARSQGSFPSAHTALAWGLLTPYAQRDDAPWLYAVATLTNAGRVLKREHWLSDTVAGSLLGWIWGDQVVKHQVAAKLGLTDLRVGVGASDLVVQSRF